MSRLTGRLMTMPLLPYFRVLLYKLFGKVYGVNFEEINIDSLNDFVNFQQFFTRELKPEARPIDSPEDRTALVSPCDGRVLSCGTVDANNFTMDCIKGNAYRVDEFWFGLKQFGKNHESPMEKVITSAKVRGQKIMFMVVYLAPGDYHRFHSPATFTAVYRRHLPGFLKPVDPRYVKKHRDVFKSNERVNLFGDWTYGFFGVSFVGATNVGSVKIHFDQVLKTNVRSPKSYLSDWNYTTLSPTGSALKLFPVDTGKSHLHKFISNAVSKQRTWLTGR